MKKYIIPIMAALALASCTSDFDEMNKPSTGLTKDAAQPMYIFGRTLYNGASNDHQRNFNLNDDMYAHYFAQGLGWTDFWRYNAGWGDIYWRDFYTERLQEYWLIDEVCGDQEIYSCIKAANDIWNVVLWLRVVDRYGDAPYFDEEGNFGAGKGSTLPYSKVADIYADLISRLKNDVDLLGNTENQVDFGAYDFLFNNDWKMWKKFANTLIMRLAMRTSGYTQDFKSDFVMAALGAFNSASDIARISCDTGVWGDYYDRTHNDWGNTFTNCDFLSMMNGNNAGYSTGVVDPRRRFFFVEGPDAATAGNSNWDGYPFNYTSDTEEAVVTAHGDKMSFARLNMANVNGIFHYSKAGNENLSWVFSNYSEVLFLKAEAILRGWITGDAEATYKSAIKASMDGLGEFIKRSGGTDKITTAEYNDYIAALPAFGTTNEQKLRSVMIQKWIATFPNSEEAWTDQRRTGYPDYYSGVLTYPAVSASSGVSVGNIIQRIPYPENEYTTNSGYIPSEFKDYNAKNMEKGIVWSLKGENGVQSKNTAVSNGI